MKRGWVSSGRQTEARREALERSTGESGRKGQGGTTGVIRQIDSSHCPRGKCQESVNQLITLVFERVRFSSDEAGLPSSSRLYQSSEARSCLIFS